MEWILRPQFFFSKDNRVFIGFRSDLNLFFISRGAICNFILFWTYYILLTLSRGFDFTIRDAVGFIVGNWMTINEVENTNSINARLNINMYQKRRGKQELGLTFKDEKIWTKKISLQCQGQKVRGNFSNIFFEFRGG